MLTKASDLKKNLVGFQVIQFNIHHLPQFRSPSRCLLEDEVESIETAKLLLRSTIIEPHLALVQALSFKSSST
jgi:hypothetical protein